MKDPFADLSDEEPVGVDPFADLSDEVAPELVEPVEPVESAAPPETTEPPEPVGAAAGALDPFADLSDEVDLSQPVRRIPGTPLRVPMPQPSAGMTTSERLSFEASGATAPEVPGLEFAGARLSQLPEELTIKPPEDIKKRSKRLTGEELEVKWAETAYVYNRLDNPSERVKVLADFFYAWDPEVADRFGLKEDGTVEAEGIWWAFDRFDKWFPTERPLRAAINSLYDLRKWYSAADLSDDIERPKFDDVARMLYRNWEQDKGSFEDGEKAFKSLGMYLSGLALGGTDEEKAKALFELDANWDQSADSTAKAITSFGWSAAKPAIKALTGANEEQFQRAKDEAVAQGEGGHMVIGLGGLMLGDTIRGITNLASGKAATSLAPEAEEAINDLMTGGVDLTEQGKLAIASHADDLQAQARRVLMSDIVEANPAMDLSRLSKISKQIDETEDLIETYETSAVVRPDFAEAELPALRELKDTLDEQFYSVYDELKPKDVKRKGGVVSGVSSLLPAKSAEKAIKSRLRILAAMDMNDAVDVAFKYNAPLAGIDSLKVFTRLRHIANSNDIPMNQMDKAWADAALRADARGEVLVKGVPEMSAGELLRVNGVSKTPEVADIYRRALKGEFGDAARVSAQRPEYNALETLLSRGVKGVPSFSDLKKTAKEGLENQTKVFRDLKDAARMRAAADGTTVVGRAARRAGETIASAIPGASKAAKTADGRIMRAQSLVDNISPVGFLVAHKIAGIGGVGATFDKLRRAVNGMMHLRGPARVQAYTTQVDGFTRQIDRRHLVHPGLHYKAQKAERQRLRNASALRSRLPEVERKLATITTNKAILRIARDYIERGWVDETELAQLEQELYTAAAFRELTGVIESVEALFSLQKVGTPGARPLGDLSVISPEDTRRAVESLRHLKTVNIGDNPAFDPEALDALASDIVAYGDAVEADLLVPLAERRRMKVGGEAEAERLDRLRNVKKQLGSFADIYEAVLRGNLGTRTELSINKMADSYTPEITRLQGDLIEIEKRLNQTKGDVAEGFDVDAAVAEALAGAREALPGAKFAEDVLPVADEVLAGAKADEPVGDIVTEAIESKHPPRLASVIQSGRYVVRDLGEGLDRYGMPTGRRLYEYRAKGTQDWPAAERVTKNPDTGEVLGRRKAGNYDPKIATVSYVEDEFGSTPSFTLKEGFLKEIPQDDTLMYRGMSWEEFESVQKSGQIKSRGEYNLGPEQEGLTYFTSDALAADSYASGFAPAQFKPTPEKPAVIVSVRRREGVPVSGTAEHEIGIRGSIAADEIVDVWVGRPYQATTGKTDVIDDSLGFRDGSGVAPTSKVAWKKEGMSFSPAPLASRSPVASVDVWKKSFEESGLARDVYEASVIGAIKAGEDVPDSVVNALPSAKVAQLQGELELLARSLAEGTKAAEGAIKSAEKGAYGAVARKAGVAQKQAKVAARTGVRAKGGASSIRALSRQIKEAQRRANFAIPVGSKNRQLLEATRQLYRSRMAEISGIIRDEATLMRQETANAIEGLLENVIPSGIVSPDERRLVEQAVDAIMQTISPKSPEIPSVGKERINKTFRKLLDPDTLERIARRQIEVDRIKDPKKRATEQAKLDDKKLKLSESIEELVASGVKMTPLDAAIHSISPAARKATAGMPGKRLTLKDIKERAAKGSPELKAFIRSLDDLDNDLRHPKDIRRSLEATISSSFNNLEKAAFDFQDKLRAFEASEWARGLKGMTVSQRHRVARIVQNPKHHDLIGGKKILVSELQTKLAKVSQAARKLEQEGKDNSRQVQTKADIEEKLALLGDAEESQRIIDAARVMKKFFDDWKKDLEDVGVLSDLDVDEFFSRVNVAGYIPHVLSFAGGKKIAALRARNALPSNSSPNFARLRKITGTIDEINDRFRRELAESIVGHQALRGVYGEAAARAAEGGSFKEFAEEAAAQGTLRSYDELVDSVNVEFGLDSVYEFFETDPLVLMERYNSQASRSVADAVFIEDILDIFPMGRQFSRIYGNRADADYAASQAGYVRLDKVSHLESILRTPLPKKLREFEPYIRRRLDEGVSMPEIVTELKAFDVDVDPDIVASMRAPDVYVPVSVGEYLNWKNTSDAGYADSAFGKLADRVHSWMKAQATIAAFAHIMRNVIGNVVSTAQEIGWSAINWRYQLAAIRIWGDIGSADDIIQIGKHSLTRDEWQGIFREAGFFETPLSSDFAYEMGRGGLKQIPTLKDLGVQLASTVAGAAAGAGVGALFGVAPAAAFGGAALSLAARRALWSPKIVNGNRSLTKFAKDTIEEIKAAPEEALSGAIPGLLIGSATGGVGAILGAAIGASTMSDYLKMMGGLNASVEAQARLSMGIGAIAKGKNFDEALGSVNAALRDYSDLTPFEKNVLRRVFFFYTWEAGNLKFQLDWLRRRPRAAAMVSRFMNGLYKEQFTEEEISMIPENWRYRVILRTGASKMIGISGLPFESALDILTRGERPVFDAMVQRLHPVPLTAMEFFIGGGKSVYYGREWRDLTNVRQLKNAPPGLKWAVGFPKEGEETWTEVYKDGVVVGQRPVYVAKNPTIFYLLQRLPGWRVMNQYMAVAADTFDSYALDAGDESAKATNLDRALMFVLGYRFTSVDMETMGQIASAKLERKLLDELDRVNSRSVVEMRKLRKDYSAPKQ